MTEAEMWANIKKLHPLAERIESTVTSGFPDCVVPTPKGWVLLELKIVRGRYINLQKSQLSFFVRTRFLTGHSEPKILVYCGDKSGYRLFTVLDILGKAELFKGKVRIEYDKTQPHSSLEEVLASLM